MQGLEFCCKGLTGIKWQVKGVTIYSLGFNHQLNHTAGTFCIHHANLRLVYISLGDSCFCYRDL